MIAVAPDDRTVPATIEPATAAAIAWQAVVVGAGPAGSATALRLARAGWKVLLLDRCDMPRAKVCGSCLSSRARDELRLLRPAPVGAAIVGEKPLAAVRLVAAGRAVRLPLPAGGVVSREVLDTALLRAAVAAGADWLPGIDVTGITEPAGTVGPLRVAGRPAADRAGTWACAAEHAVIAAGLVDHVRVPQAPPAGHIRPGSRVGIGAVLEATACDVPEGELVMAVDRTGYCGMVRLEDGRIDVAAAVDRHALAAATSIPAAVRTILEASGATRHGIGLAEPAGASAAFRATPPLTRTAPLVAGAARRVFRVGDAAGYVEPFTGEGIGWALSGARLLATALLTAADPASAYEAAHAACLGRPHRRCGRIAAALRHAGLVGPAVGAACMAPWVARRIVPLVIGASADRGALG